MFLSWHKHREEACCLKIKVDQGHVCPGVQPQFINAGPPWQWQRMSADASVWATQEGRGPGALQNQSGASSVTGRLGVGGCGRITGCRAEVTASYGQTWPAWGGTLIFNVYPHSIKAKLPIIKGRESRPLK